MNADAYPNAPAPGAGADYIPPYSNRKSASPYFPSTSATTGAPPRARRYSNPMTRNSPARNSTGNPARSIRSSNPG